MKLSALLLDIARDLNDAEPGHEFTRWPQQSLARWFNEGRCNAFTLNPSQFSQVVVVKLQPGTEQQACNGGILHDILGQTDARGLITTPINRTDMSMSTRWTKTVNCCVTGASTTKLTGYTFTASENGLFSVEPPVPPGADVYVKVVCYTRPSDLSLTDDVDDSDDCATTAAATQWALFRAMMRDDESIAAQNAAAVHRQMFFDLLNVRYTREREAQLDMADTKGARGAAT
jgi:hypothetical protein